MQVNRDTTMADMINQLREFFGSETVDRREQAKLWDVLAALRGPDETGRHNQKTAVTGVIREAFLGPAARQVRNVKGVLINSDAPEFKSIRDEIFVSQDYSHYAYHGQDAFRALGIPW